MRGLVGSFLGKCGRLPFRKKVGRKPSALIPEESFGGAEMELERGLRADPADLEARLRGIVERARGACRGSYFELLCELELWRRAPAALQDQVLAEVKMRLGGSFEFAGWERFAEGPLGLRVASFRHRVLSERGVSPLDGLFRLVPGGSFRMGSGPEDPERLDSEAPVREVWVAPLLVGASPVTIGAYGAPDYDFDDPRDRPMYFCSWEMVKEWIDGVGDGLRLPSEAQWEYFCRGGTAGPRFCREEELGDYACFNESREEILKMNHHAVGAKKANPFGLFDLFGAVAEWCEDSWHGDYRGAPRDDGAWVTETEERRVLRGGSRYSRAGELRSARRDSEYKGAGSDVIGFRVVRALDQ